MELLKFSIQNLKDMDYKLYQKVIEDYSYDLVIFIAKGSFLIGKDLAEFNNVPLISINATRSVNKAKKIINPILKILPTFIKKYLRQIEVKSNIHTKNNDRLITYDKNIWSKYRACKKILIVDDSIDTGFSMKLVKEEVRNFFADSEIKIATLNYFKKSEEIIKCDFYLYCDCMLTGPWSNDSKENKIFNKLYSEWEKKDTL